MKFFDTFIIARVCNLCAERRDEEERQQALKRRQMEAVRNARSREEAWSKFCPVEFRLPNESDGKTLLATLELAQPGVKDLMQWKGPKGLIIRGATGKCKTRGMWRLVRKLWMEGKRVKVLTSGQFERQCRDAGGQFNLTSWFDQLADCDVFVLDDLGKQPWSPATEATWFDLVDQRTRENRPIIVTTNDNGDTLSSRMAPERGEAVIRRLREYCDQIVFT